MKITILGANSFIARNFINYLENNHKNSELNLYDIQACHIDKKKNYTKINLLDKKEAEKIDYNCDLIYVFTGKTGTLNGFEEYKDFLEINELSLLNILNGLRKSKSKAKLVYPSSRLIYKGKNEKITEDSEKEFKTIYALNKFTCEEYIKMYNKMYGINYIIFRIGIPFGTLTDKLSSCVTMGFMLSNAKNNKDICLYEKASKARRTFTHINDLTRAFIEGGISPKCINDIYNIGGEDLSLENVAKAISDKYKVKVKYIKASEEADKIETGSTAFNSDKFDNLLNFKYEFNFSDWIKGME